jgi:hypothetical protein
LSTPTNDTAENKLKIVLAIALPNLGFSLLLIVFFIKVYLTILPTVFDCQAYNKGFQELRPSIYQRQIDCFRRTTKNSPDY